MKRVLVVSMSILLIGVIVAIGWAQAKKAVTLPKDWRTYKHIGSLIITDKANALFGIHHFYMNKTGLDAFNKGMPYPDGTIIVDTVYDVVASPDGKMLNEGKMLFMPYMKKNAKAAETKETGGWIFAAFAPEGKQIEKDPKKDCFECHAAVKDSDYVFSKPLK